MQYCKWVIHTTMPCFIKNRSLCRCCDFYNDLTNKYDYGLIALVNSMAIIRKEHDILLMTLERQSYNHFPFLCLSST